MAKYEINMTRCTSILHVFLDDYDGAGIYSLIDNNGKRYIGQAKHIQKRLRQHRIYMNLIFFTDSPYYENEKIHKAIRSGITFDVEILEKIPWYKATKNELSRREAYWIDYYGSYEKTYNVGFVPLLRDSYEYENQIVIEIPLPVGVIDYLKSKENSDEYIISLIREDIEKNGI